MPSSSPAGKSAVRRLKKPYGKNNSFTPSIKDALGGKKQAEQPTEIKEEKVAVVETYNQPDKFEAFTEEQLHKTWKQFADSLIDHPALVATLVNFPEIKENGLLMLPIENSYQDEAIQRIKPKLKSFLRRELRNDSIELETYITEIAQTKRIYFDHDKLNAMADTNPSILELKRRFNLDFDNGDH